MIEVNAVSKRFKLGKAQRKENPQASPWLYACHNISFRCEPGRVYTLLGPNGAGKTTTLRMIATIIAQDEGQILVDGCDTLTHPRDVKRSMGFLTGSTGLYERLTPAEVLKYFADLNKVSSADFRRKRDELYDRLGIGPFASKRIGKLSTGMKQKVSIARTLIHDPAVLVFDEPTSGLDVITAKSIMDLIRDSRDAGKTVLFSTHIMGEVSLLSDDLGIVHKGKLIFDGTYKSFREQAPSDSLVEEFIRFIEKAEEA